MAYEVQLDIFEGPLDLLLHLIHRNEVRVTDVPVAVIARQYLEAVEVARSVNLDVAGEYLVMASSLAHIKSRMLLPLEDDGDEEEAEEAPHEDLITHLLEYRRYKDAALRLAERPLLDVDTFLHVEPDPAGRPEHFKDAVPEVRLEDLVGVFRDLIERMGRRDRVQLSPEGPTMRELMRRIVNALRHEDVVELSSFPDAREGRRGLVAVFLALLEMARLQKVFLRQDAPLGPLFVSVKAHAESLKEAETTNRPGQVTQYVTAVATLNT
jgi:segregation and condensation protein A